MSTSININVNNSSTGISLPVEIDKNTADELPPLGTLKECDIQNLTREELKRWCSVYGIRRNIKTTEMRISLYNILNQIPIDQELYIKSNRIILTKKKKISGVIIIFIIIFIIVFFSTFKSRKLSPPTHMTNGTYSPF